MQLGGLGLLILLACKLACISACTAILLAREHTTSRTGPRWLDNTLAACGVASAACALAVACFQVHRARTGSASRAGVALAAAGAAAHTAMLAALSLYWARLYRRAYYKASHMGDGRRVIVHRSVNYFQYYGLWSDEEAALFALGCLAGVGAWLVALTASALDAHRAARQLAASSMPLAASAPHAASLMVPVVAEQPPPPAQRQPPPLSSASALPAPRNASHPPGALPLPAKLVAALEADALLPPGTPVPPQPRAQQA